MARRILVIDDSLTIRDLVRYVLEQEGYEVLDADDGLTGLEILRNEKDISLILTDAHMPNMDGLTMVEEIKKEESLSSIPIVVITLETSDKMKGRARDAGANGWIVKPIVREDLVKVVSDILKKSQV